MSKRIADKYLTDQNWEEEDEPEEAGRFRTAEKEILEKRVFKTAKRRNPESSKSAGAFTGFTGLKLPNTSFGNNAGFKSFSASSFTIPDASTKALPQLIPDDIVKKESIRLGITADPDSAQPPAKEIPPVSTVSKTALQSSWNTTENTSLTLKESTPKSDGPLFSFTSKPSADNDELNALPLPEIELEVEQASNWIESESFSEAEFCWNSRKVSELLKQFAEKDCLEHEELTGNNQKVVTFHVDADENLQAKDMEVTQKLPDFLWREPDRGCDVIVTKSSRDHDVITDGPRVCFVFASDSFEYQLAPAEEKRRPTELSANLNEETDDAKRAEEYNRHLSALNRSVSKWIGQHVEKNPLCDLTPIFKDYQKHLAKIDEDYGEIYHSECSDLHSQNSLSESSDIFSVKTVTPLTMVSAAPGAMGNTLMGSDLPIKSASDPLIWDSSQSSTTVDRSPPKSDVSSFTLTRDVPKSNGSSQHSIETGASDNSPFRGFNMNPVLKDLFSVKSKPPTFPSAPSGSAGPSDPKKSTNDDGDYAPPVPEVNIVKEEDAIYTKKCKLFHMKEGSYADRGVGHLHLKPVPSSGKTQLIIRADTTLGNLLLNIVLNSAMPISKQGKNNVALSCVPNPPIDDKEKDKVVPMLIRVKTSDDANELEKLLNEKKNVD